MSRKQKTNKAAKTQATRTKAARAARAATAAKEDEKIAKVKAAGTVAAKTKDVAELAAEIRTEEIPPMAAAFAEEVLEAQNRANQLRAAEIREATRRAAKALAVNIKNARTKANLTQAEAAARAGIASWTWSRWELGKQDARLSNILSVARVCGVPAAELLKGI